jgi:selT/selW/selH-like putative selenoprotein
MKKNFINLRNFLEQKYPQLVGHIQGENYPLSPAVQALVSGAAFLQIFGVCFVFMGNRLFTTLGIPTPPWFGWMQENKMMTIGGLFVVNSVVQSSAATGAFEISYNGESVFSKLETGRMPNLREILNNLNAAGLAEESL